MFIEPEDIRPGTIVEWMGCPVVVLGVPDNRPRCYAPAAYLRCPREVFTYAKGQVITEFQCNWKELWTKPLTDEEEALAMRLLLIGE